MKKSKILKISILIICCCLLCGIVLSGCEEKALPKDENLPEMKIGGAIYEPYFYIDENGDHAGIDVELAKEACKRMGYKPVFVTIEWVDKDELLRDGTIDCAWACFSMNNRDDEYDWAGPYASDRQVVAVLSKSNIYQLSDLKGASIAVQMLSQPTDVFLEKTDPRIPELKSVYCLENIREAISALCREYVDACAGHESAIKSILDSSSVEYRILDDPILITDLGVAFSKGVNTELCQKLDKALSDMINDGTVRSVFSSYGLYESGVSKNEYR